MPSKYEATFEKVMMWNYQCRLGKNISNAFLLAKPWACLVTIKKVDHKVLCYYLACIKTPLSLKFHNIYLKELSAKTSTSTFKHSFVYICDSLMKKTWTHSQYVFYFLYLVRILRLSQVKRGSTHAVVFSEIYIVLKKAILTWSS